MRRIAVYHDYLNQYGGAERVLEELLVLFPQAEIFTLFYDRKRLPQFSRYKVHTSIAQRFPFIFRHHQMYFLFYPFLVRLFNFKAYDLVISSTHAWGNGLRKGSVPCFVYCHTPVRYFWDLYENYMANQWIPWLARKILPWIRAWICAWDKRGAERADGMVANSREVAGRILRNYGRQAQVIYPPVKVDFFGAKPVEAKQDYYLVVCRLKAYKRVDLIIQAFNQLNKPLFVVGEGEEEKTLRQIAGDTICFVKRVSDEALRSLYANARGYVYMAHEDFGMSLVEAQAAGTAVVAFGRGGACESVVPEETGILIPDQTVDALMAGVLKFEKYKWDVARLQANAARFGLKTFAEALLEQIESLRAKRSML